MRALSAFCLFVVLAASAASAAKFVPEPSDMPVRPGTVRPAPPVQIAAAPSVAIRQTPVPLQWKYKHQTVPVPDGPTIADLVSQATTSAPSGTEQSAARAAIEADGYRGVRDIAQGPNGTWKARALRGSTEIGITVTADGRVSAD